MKFSNKILIHLCDPILECPSHDIQEFINIFSGIFVKIVKPVKNMFDLPWIHKPWPVLVRPRIFFFIYARVGRTGASKIFLSQAND